MKTAFVLFFLLLLYSVTAKAQQTFNSLRVKELKLPSETVSRALYLNGSGQIKSSATVTDTEMGYLDGVSSAIQTQFTGKESSITATTSADYFRGDKTFQTLNKTAVGLANVDNTSDASKPVSTATQTALNLKVNLTHDGVVAWLTATVYAVGNVVIESDKFYKCLTPHTAGTFATDLAAVKWSEVSPASSGIESMATGGTAKNLTAVNGGIVWTDADSMEIIAAGTTGQILKSNGAAAPSWITSSATGKTCYYAFGGASATLAAPTKCTTGTCVEVVDTCATGTPPTWSATGTVLNMTFANGTWANSTFIDCRCMSWDTTNAAARDCLMLWDTGDSSWSTNASGGYVAGYLLTTGHTGIAGDAYTSITCTGTAP